MTAQNIQQFDAIKPVNAAPTDLARVEYEAGKKALAADYYSQAAARCLGLLDLYPVNNDTQGSVTEIQNFALGGVNTCLLLRK